MKGITVTLYTQTQTGTDDFNRPIYTETPVQVQGVLVGQPSTDDLTSSVSLYGKRIDYMLGIPKGDTHDWTDKTVAWTDAYGTTHKVRTFGVPITGVEANVPTRWHMKVRCEAFG